MKKKAFDYQKKAACLLAVWILCMLFSGRTMTVLAAPPLLVDEADVLTSSQERELTEKLEEVSSKYDIDVAVYTVESLDGKDALDYADDIYVYDEYGTGDEYSGILLLHKPSNIPGETEYAITSGGRVKDTISPSKIDSMLDDLVDPIVDGRDSGNYLPAYEAYIELVNRNMMSRAERAADSLLERMLGSAVLAPVAGFLMSFGYMGRQKAKLKSVRRQRSAAAYTTSHGPELHVSRDILVNRTISKVPIRRESDNKSSGSSGGRPAHVHTHSSGRVLSGGSRRV